MSNKGTGLFDDKYNMGLVDANKLKTYLNNHNQAVGSDGKVYNNMESDYVAGKNMLDDFASMLSKDDIELDVEKSKVIENKQKNTAELASQEELDPAQEEVVAQFLVQLSEKLKLDVVFCKELFAEELETDDEGVNPKNTSKTMQNKGRDKFMDAFAKAYNPKNKQQANGLGNLDKKRDQKFDKKKLNKVIKKFAKKYKLNPKAIKKSLNSKIKQSVKKNKLTDLTTSLKTKNNKSQATQSFSIQGVNMALSPKSTPQQHSQQKSNHF